jgi:hypothetical protein
MNGSKYCYAHKRLMEVRTQKMDVPLLEDPNSIVVGLMKGLQAMMKGQIDLKFAGMYFYGLQIAASVMGRVNFEAEQEEGD